MIAVDAASRKWLFLLPLPIILVGMVGFRIIEGWPWVDCFFMTVTTVSTVGYGWIGEPDTAGKVFASFLILTGVGTFSFMISLGLQNMLEQTVDQDRVARKKVEKIRDHFIICGAGRVGLEVAAALRKRGRLIVAVDRDTRAVESIRHEGMLAIEGDATNEESLAEAGIERAKGVACVLEHDADNIFVCLAAREKNPTIFIVARASNQSAVNKMLKAGANKVINPFTTTATRIAYTLMKPTVVDFLEVASSDLHLDLRMEEILIQPGSVLVGCHVAEAEFRERENVIAAAIQKKGGLMIFNPPAAEILDERDVLIALGSQESLTSLAEKARGRG
ncbi:MAG: Glutathione-regulated potassium-efflux system protein KefC [bacterium]|nr:Glutathione-regulated potassium-efflux system protein KefC [bacterium]